jgi:hypothetical protein
VDSLISDDAGSCLELDHDGYVAPDIKGSRGMPQVGTKLVALVKLCSVLTMASVLLFTISAVPARAQDIFGFFRAFAPPPAPAPTYHPFRYYHSPARERRKPKLRPKPAAVEQTEAKKPVKPRTPGEMDNPVPALLADSTLQPGDMVMFPDGLRVFTGRVRGQHTMADFKPLAQAGKHLSRATRKLVAHLLPSENPAWSMDGVKSGSKLAANTDDGDTATVKRASSHNGSRYR